MKVVILNSKDTEKIIEQFIAEGFDDFIAFGSVNKSYYELNGINVTEVNGSLGEGNGQKLQKIKGSLTKRFFVAYSIPESDLKKIEKLHLQSQETATLGIENERLTCAVFEPEIFDHVDPNLSFEREILLRVGQSGEMYICQ